jgi:micrococcal nuclease
VVTVDGKSLNQSLVKNGMAWWYRKYAPADTTLKQLEYEARTKKIGIWSEKDAVAPWDWRKGTRPAPNVAKLPRLARKLYLSRCF